MFKCHYIDDNYDDIIQKFVTCDNLGNVYQYKMYDLTYKAAINDFNDLSPNITFERFNFNTNNTN